MGREKFWFVVIFVGEQKIALKLTQNRSARFMSEFIVQNVPIGSIIISDEWRGYNGLQSLKFRHFRINHSVRFVDPEVPWIHSNNIEMTWRTLRESIPINISEEIVKEKLKKFVMEFNEKIKRVSEKFEFILHVLRIY
jgi:hypothetical protein